MPTTLSPPSALGLRWTDYPLMDAALAGLCVFSQVRRPEDLTAEHLQTFQRWAEDAYFSPEVTSWISVVFTSNFINYSFTPAKRREVLREILGSYQRPGLLGVPCAIFPELPAQQRVARDLMPMLMGRGPMNFYPDGQPGLPLSGQAITALQGLSLAAPLVSGRALVLDADDKQLLLDVVAEWQEPWLKRISLSRPGDEKKPIWAAARTRLMEAIRKVIEKQPSGRGPARLPFAGGATLYHLTNSGQGPDAAIYTLEQPALRFMELASQNFPGAWKPLFDSRRYEADKTKDSAFGFRNELDEALFSLPDEAPFFLRRYLMPPFTQALREAKAEARKGKSSKKTEKNAPPVIPLAGLWGITELFLMEVVGMEKARVEAVEALGQRLGRWIVAENDKRLFRELYEARGAGPLRHVLLKAMLEKSKGDAKSGTEDRDLITTKDEYLRIFTEAEEVTRADFTLARDLLKMRVIQYLHDARFFEENRDDPELQNTELPNEEGEK
ncbi:hypothetical protein V3W47_18570 [Deinococcus sp. YIM 134068]|uniref:hypothetical protein n=1 Tax=Deinococcus lichenicola TaxID=3118910 RepID=UPI002F921D82